MKRNLFALLALCLMMGSLWGCQKSDPEPTPAPTPTQGPQTIVDVHDENEQPDTMNTTVNGEDVTLTLVTGSFQRSGGPDFSLYVNKTRFQVNDVDGCCYLTTDEGRTYAEIGFRENTDAEMLSATFLREYGNLQDSSDLGEQTLGENTARQLAGYTMDSAFEAWLIDVEGGCVTLVICSPLGDVSGVSYVATDAVQLIDALSTLTLT